MVNKPNVNKIEWLLVEDITSLKEHIAQWQQLIIETESNLFCSPEWIMTWIQTYWQPNWQLKTIIGFENKKLVAIAPLYIQPSNTLISLAKLLPLGQGEPEESEVLSEFQDIVLRHKTESIYSEIAKQISSIKWNVICWNSALSKSSLVKVLPYLKHSITKTVGQRYLLLESEDYLTTLSKNNRQKWNKCKNKLTSLNARFLWVLKEDFESYWQTMIIFHQKRWEKKDKQGAFFSQNFIDFHNNYQKDNTTRISVLLINEEPIAINYYLQDFDTLYFYQCGWNDDSYAKLSPGFSLHLWSIINNPLKKYDFMLGSTNDSYKSSFGTSTKEEMLNVIVQGSYFKYFINKFTSKLLRLKLKRKINAIK